MRLPYAWILALLPLACSGTNAGVDLENGTVDGGAGDGARADATRSGDGAGVDSATTIDAGDGACSGPAATFSLVAKGSFCTGSQCNDTWLTIVGPSGPLSTGGYLCATDCATCITRPCPPGPCAQPIPVPPNGATTTWDGSYFTNETRTCNGKETSCYQTRCAAPGHYTARMCAYARTDDSGLYCAEATTATCVEVPFDWPATATVIGTIGH